MSTPDQQTAARYCRVRQEMQDGHDVFFLEGECTIYYADIMHVQLLQCVTSHAGPIEINLSAVNALDTTGLQILLLCKRSASGALRFVAHSTAIRSIVELLQLGDVLDIPQTDKTL